MILLCVCPQVLRLMRLARIFRLFRVFKELFMLLRGTLQLPPISHALGNSFLLSLCLGAGLVNAARALSWVGFLLTIIFYVCAV